MKNFFLLLLSSIFLISLVSAAGFSVGFNAYDGTIDGIKIINGTSPVYDFYVKGYTCLDLTCTQINTTAFSFSDHSTSNKITLFFPAQAKYGYVLYFYKDGYIGNEMKGNGSGVNVPVYLYRKTNGTAQINNIQGVNTNISNGTILNLNYLVDSSNAILDKRTANFPLNESVNVRSWLVIRNDSNNQIISFSQKSNSLNYSGTFSNSFSYQFNNSGKYNITIISEIFDRKIINPTNSTFSFLTNVYVNISGINQNNTNNNQTNNTNNLNQTNLSQYSYSNLSNIIFPSNISVNQTVPFSFNYSNIYFNGSNNFYRDGNLTISIFNLTNLLSKFNYTLSRQLSNYTWNYNFSKPGNYTINFYLCPIIEIVGENYSCASRNISFFVYDVNASVTNNSTNQTEEEKDNSCKNCKKSRKVVTQGYVEKVSSGQVAEYEEDSKQNIIKLNFKNTERKNFAEIVYNWVLFILVLSMLLVFLIILFYLKNIYKLV